MLCWSMWMQQSVVYMGQHGLCGVLLLGALRWRLEIWAERWKYTKNDEATKGTRRSNNSKFVAAGKSINLLFTPYLIPHSITYSHIPISLLPQACLP